MARLVVDFVSFWFPLLALVVFSLLCPPLVPSKHNNVLFTACAVLHGVYGKKKRLALIFEGGYIILAVGLLHIRVLRRRGRGGGRGGTQIYIYVTPSTDCLYGAGKPSTNN